MSLLSFDLSKLYTSGVSDLVPQKNRDVVAAEQLFKDFTIKPEGFYSGYRSYLKKDADEALKDYAQELAQNFDTMFVCGIGGSSLGAQSVLEALNESSKKVIFLDNLDTIHFSRCLEGTAWEKSCMLIVSKAGGTVETMLNAARILEKFEDAGLSRSKHCTAITTEGKGLLFQWAQEHSIRSFFIPEDIGGRYSLMTPVGLLPLFFAGVDVDSFLEGARSEFESPHEKLWPLVSRLEDFEEARFPILSIWTYSSPLYAWGRWFQQLWAESLGKPGKNGVGRGSFPLPCIGANDQHSLLQMFMEGSLRAVAGVLTLEEWPEDRDWKVKLESPFSDKLAFTVGKKYSEVLNAEAKATAAAFEQVQRPCFEMSLPSLDAKSLGALYAWSMDLTVASGALKKINPFDQPGVEIGKKILPTYLQE